MVDNDDNQLEEAYGFRYTRKDLILYALSIGMGCLDETSEQVEEDLRFLYEQHPKFSPLPIFCFTFMFWSNTKRNDQTSGVIPPFPPPLMANEEILPGKLLEADVDLTNHPLIHTWQCIVWDKTVPLAADRDGVVETSINLKTISVQPKSVGTFVTTQSQVTTTDPSTNEKSLLCILQSTTLVFGVSKGVVRPYDSGVAKMTSRPVIPYDSPPLLDWTYATRSNQALLYRIASGDSNRIHVDNSASKMTGSEKKAPLLHGLFSLAVAFRAVLKLVPDADRTIRRLEARFTQPAFVGDVLSVRIWRSQVSSSELLFVVLNKESGVTLVDMGCAELQPDGFVSAGDSDIRTELSRL